MLTVCGVGMGSSLILKMTAEKALRELGVPARVEHSDLSSARSAGADVILAQSLHTSEMAGASPIIIAVTNFLDVAGLRDALAERLREKGWFQS